MYEACLDYELGQDEGRFQTGMTWLFYVLESFMSMIRFFCFLFCWMREYVYPRYWFLVVICGFNEWVNGQLALRELNWPSA